MNIYILTGDIATGKTTQLLKWCENKNGVKGICTPVINGKRYFLDLSSGEKRMMEAGANEKDVQVVGRFVFSSAGFKWAEEVIINSLISSPSYLVIDEAGPLELNGKGFHYVLQEVLQSDIKVLVLVVRKSKVEEVINVYDLKRSSINIISHPEEIL